MLSAVFSSRASYTLALAVSLSSPDSPASLPMFMPRPAHLTQPARGAALRLVCCRRSRSRAQTAARRPSTTCCSSQSPTTVPRPSLAPPPPRTHTHTVHGAIRPPCSVMVGSGRPATSCEMISLMLCRAVLVDLLPTAALLTYFRPIPRKPKTPPHLPTTAAGYVPAFGAAGASAQWRPAGGAGEAGEGLLAGLADPGGGGGGALAPAGLPAVGGMGGGGGGSSFGGCLRPVSELWRRHNGRSCLGAARPSSRRHSNGTLPGTLENHVACVTLCKYLQPRSPRPPAPVSRVRA